MAAETHFTGRRSAGLRVKQSVKSESEGLCKRIVNRNGNPIADLQRYQNRRIKWARRHGKKVVVTLESSFGVSGITLVFDSPELYESCVSRVFVSHPRPDGQASNRESFHDAGTNGAT